MEQEGEFAKLAGAGKPFEQVLPPYTQERFNDPFIGTGEERVVARLGLETLSNSPQGLHGESVRDKYKAGVKKLRKELSAAVKGGKLAGYEERRLRERCRGAWRGWEACAMDALDVLLGYEGGTTSSGRGHDTNLG
mmetsp:Transcript_12274/g.38753  ORF Transcript_12274/g.38753 Transcript_12274/m.38753 type:complete len:136 (-) Transcript_12274:402-809(-)